MLNQRHRSVLDLVNRQMASTFGPIAPIDLQTGGAIYPIFVGKSDSVQFVSLSSIRFMENPGLTMVSYDVDPRRPGDVLTGRARRAVPWDLIPAAEHI